MRFSEIFIRRPIGTSLLMSAICLSASSAYPLPAGRAAAAGRFPDHPGHGSAARRERRDDGIFGGDAAGDAVPPDLRPRPDDSSSSLGTTQHHGAVRPRPQHRRGRQDVQAAINAAQRSAAEEPAEPADLRKVNPADCADPRRWR